jgi:hypothetical protein
MKEKMRVIAIRENYFPLLDELTETRFGIKAEIADGFSIVDGLQGVEAEDEETLRLCLRRLNNIVNMIYMARPVYEGDEGDVAKCDTPPERIPAPVAAIISNYGRDEKNDLLDAFATLETCLQLGTITESQGRTIAWPMIELKQLIGELLIHYKDEI